MNPRWASTSARSSRVYDAIKAIVEGQCRRARVVELPEIMGLSNRIYVMHAGRVVAQLPGKGVAEADIPAHFPPRARLRSTKEAQHEGLCSGSRSAPGSWTAPLALVVLFVGLALTEPRFLGPQNLINVLRGGALLMIVACGQMLGADRARHGPVGRVDDGVDQRRQCVGHGAPGAGLGPGRRHHHGIAAGLAVGVVVGLCNGIAVAVFGITPFMVTLAMASIVGGVALSLTNGIPIYGLPEAFRRRSGPHAVAGHAADRVGGGDRGAVGLDRPEVHGAGNAHLRRGRQPAGQPGLRHRCALPPGAGLRRVRTGRIAREPAADGPDRFRPGSVGDTLALQSIGAAVIAGVSLHGGVGRVQWVALGSLFLLLLNNAMDLLRVDSKAQAIVMGLLIVLVVALDEFEERRKDRWPPKRSLATPSCAEGGMSHGSWSWRPCSVSPRRPERADGAQPAQHPDPDELYDDLRLRADVRDPGAASTSARGGCLLISVVVALVTTAVLGRRVAGLAVAAGIGATGWPRASALGLFNGACTAWLGVNPSPS